MFRTIRAWLLKRKINRSEDDLRFLRNLLPGDRNYDAAQELIPLVEEELRTLRDRLNEFRSGRP